MMTSDLITLSVAAERQRVLTELHDVIGQELTMVVLECDRALEADRDGPGTPGLRRIRCRAAGLIESVAALALGTAPVSLRESVDRAARDLTMAGVAFRQYLGTARLAPDADALLGCVVREGVTNVLRHAPAATACEISLRADGGTVLVIRNDGVARTRPGRPGAGIGGLRERAARLGARVGTSVKGGSFVLSAYIPPGG